MTHFSAGRTAGFLILAQVVTGVAAMNIAIPEALSGLKPLAAFLNAAMALGVAILLYPVFARYSNRLALAYLILASMVATLSVVEAGAALAVAEDAVLRPVWFWAHYVKLFVAGIGFLFLFAMLFGCRLVPRWLAGLGLLATASQLVSVSMPYFGQPVSFPMLAPMGLTLIVLGIWLVAKGLPD